MPLTERVTRLPPKGTEGVGDGERATQGLAELVERIVLVMMADGEAFLLRELETHLPEHSERASRVSATPIDLAQIVEEGRHRDTVRRKVPGRRLHRLVHLQAVLCQSPLLQMMPAPRLREIARRLHEANDVLYFGSLSSAEYLDDYSLSGHEGLSLLKNKDRVFHGNTYSYSKGLPIFATN